MPTVDLKQIIAPVINGVANPNEVKLLDCLAYNLAQLSDPTFLPNGILVDRRRDPRMLQQDKPAQFQKTNAVARLSLGDGIYNPKGSTGGGLAGKRRTHQIINIVTCQAMTQAMDNVGIVPDQLKAYLRHAVSVIVNTDWDLKTASAALATAFPGWGTGPSCIGMKITKYIAVPIANTRFPEIYQGFRIELDFDEFGASLQAGYAP